MRISNPTDQNIINFRIETPQILDVYGGVYRQGKTESNYPRIGEEKPPALEGLSYRQSAILGTKGPKRSQYFSLKAGETGDFPKYAAEILLKQFGFLKKV